ncbi:hypothetical protein [Aliikangiella sp. IMCC44359]|uniref:hypothetical protein n=1 Tax=Aliikangiella sp. IMCC44359 TaxID=3459125 RepID=UPI00403ACB2F
MNKKNNVTRYSLLFLTTLSVGNYATAAPYKNDNALTSGHVVQQTQNSFLQNLVVRSDLIFRGKLTEISEGLSVEEIPYTFVTYQVDEVVTGQYSEKTITLKFVGGEFPNGNRLSASNSPDVQLGEEAILMVQQSKDTGCDFVDCQHGRFVLEDGEIIAANESAIVVDGKGGIDYISFAARKSGTHKASLAKSNIPHFISHLKSLDKVSLMQRKSAKIAVSNTDKTLPFKAYSALTQAKSVPKIPKSAVSNKPRKSESNPHDQWEEEELRLNGGNPILSKSYPNAQN